MKLLKIQNYRKLDKAIFHGILMMLILLVTTMGMQVAGAVIMSISFLDMLMVYVILSVYENVDRYQEVVYQDDLEGFFEQLFRIGMRYESNIGKQYVFVTNYKLWPQERLLVLQNNSELKVLVPPSLKEVMGFLGKKSHIDNIGKEDEY